MNILFASEKEISPLLGGTERITQTLSCSFRRKSVTCGLLFIDSIDESLPRSTFDYDYQLKLSESVDKQVQGFLSEHAPDYIVVNFVRHRTKSLVLPHLYRNAHKIGAKVIACYHAMPGEDLLPSSMDNCIYKILHGYDMSQAVKDIMLHILPSFVSKFMVRKKYQLPILNSDMFVLLSDSFKKKYEDIAKLKLVNCVAIPNALTYEGLLDEKLISAKKKEVLIVSRMDERSKRLIYALRVWKRIEEDGKFQDWTLNIVGGGSDLTYFTKKMRKMGVKNCRFWGRQNSIDDFYRNASIFMMTSAYEGFGITLTEAQQNGVVPIVFDSYSSLHDIIEDGYNGYIVDNDDVALYAEKLKQLMRDSENRFLMARNCLDSVKRFSQDRITEIWMDLFNRLV